MCSPFRYFIKNALSDGGVTTEVAQVLILTFCNSLPLLAYHLNVYKIACVPCCNFLLTVRCSLTNLLTNFTYHLLLTVWCLLCLLLDIYLLVYLSAQSHAFDPWYNYTSLSPRNANSDYFVLIFQEIAREGSITFLQLSPLDVARELTLQVTNLSFLDNSVLSNYLRILQFL